jgi:ribonuclease VapC
LAYLLEESGAAVVENALPGALLCAVNLAEVVSKLRERGMTRNEVEAALAPVGFEVVEFGAELAMICGDLRIETRQHGLSLGDRACLALARHRGCDVLTTDAAWARLTDMRVRLLRGASA